MTTLSQFVKTHTSVHFRWAFSNRPEGSTASLVNNTQAVGFCGYRLSV